MKKSFLKAFSVILTMLFVMSVMTPAFSVIAAGEKITITDNNGNEITERVEVQEYRSVQLSYTVTPAMPEGYYVTWESNLPLLADVDDTGKITGYDYSKAAIIQLWLDEEVRSIPLVGESTAKAIEKAIASSGVDIETVNTDILVALISGIAGEQIGESLRKYLDSMNVEITATLYNEEGKKISSDKVDVLVTQSIIAQVAPTGVKITNKKTVPTTVSVGATVQLYGAVTPVRLKQGVKWSIDRSIFNAFAGEVATVSDDGLVTFINPGTVTVKVQPSSAVYAAFSDSIKFTVVPKTDLPVTDFTIGGTTSVAEGSSTRLTVADVSPAGAYTGDVVWESSDDSIAMIDQAGNVTGLDGGSGVTFQKQVTITATIGDVVRTTTFTVTRAGLSTNLSGIDIDGEDALPIGQSSQYTSTVYPARLNTNNSVIRTWGFYEDGEYIMATASTPAVGLYGTITNTGVFTPTASGMSTIVARASYNNQTIETTKAVFSGKPITDFTINGTLTIDENRTTQLSISGIAPEDYDAEILETIKWTTSDPKIATVDKDGKVKGIDGGNDLINSKRTATITATVGGISRSVTITVRKSTLSNNNITSAYIDGNAYVIKDFPVQYSASFSPERLRVSTQYWGTPTNDGQAPFDSSLLVFSSKNQENDIASVSNNGKVTGKAAGTTDIYVYGKNIQSYAIAKKTIDVVEIEPKSITVTAPYKTEYIEGDTELQTNGLKVELTYNRADIDKYYGDTSSMYTDDQLKVEVTDYEISDINPDILDVEQYVVLTVTRAGKSFRGIFGITIESKKVESIELSEPRYKYIEGETELDLTDLKVLAHYSNVSTPEYVTDYVVDVENFNPNLFNVEQNITVNYYHEGRGVSATFPVIVYGIPVVSVDSNGYAGGFTPNNITYTLSATNELEGVTYYYREEGNENWTALAGNEITFNQDQDKIYYFKAINSEGIESAETVGYEVKRDSQTPYFAVEKEITQTTNQSYDLIVKNMVIGISGIKSVTVNGEVYEEFSRIPIDKNGNYEIVVTANNGLSKKVTVTVNNIDREPPVIKSFTLKHKTTGDNARELSEEEFGLFFNEVVELTVTAEDVGIGTVDKILYRLLDETKTPISGEWLTYNYKNKPEISPNFKGYVEVKVTDTAGNESDTIYSNGIIVDGTAPTTPEISAVSKGEAYTDGDWTSDKVTITVSSEAFSGIYEYLYRIDGGEWVRLDTTTITVDDEGEHLYEFKTVSYSNLESEIASLPVKIDRQTPVIRVDFEGTFNRWTGENMTFKLSTLEESLSGITYYYNDGNGWVEITTGNEIVLYDNINANYQFMAVNGAGTKSPPSDSYIVMIDTVVPSVTLTPETEEETLTPYKIYLDYTYGEAGLKSVTLNGEDITDESYITVSKNGTYLITVTGNNLKTYNYLLTIDNFVDVSDESQKPVLQVTVNGVVGTRTGEDITFNFYTPNQKDVIYYYDNGNGWVEIDGASLTLTESQVADYTFKAVNKFGIESYESPVYSVILDKSRETGSRLSGALTVADKENAKNVVIRIFSFNENELIAKKTVSTGAKEYSFSGLADGGYILVVECDGNVTFKDTVIISGNTTLDISLAAGSRMVGDVDLDGDIDADDYDLMLLCIEADTSLTELQYYNADVNGDGAVDGMDALYMDLYLNGVITLPIK